MIPQVPGAMPPAGPAAPGPFVTPPMAPQVPGAGAPNPLLLMAMMAAAKGSSKSKGRGPAQGPDALDRASTAKPQYPAPGNPESSTPMG